MLEQIINKINRKIIPIIADEGKPFIKQNQDFWSSFSAKDGKKILIEGPYIPVITHVHGLYSIILNQAKSLTPVWLNHDNCDVELLKSYIPTAEYLKVPRFSLRNFKIAFVSIWKFLIMYKTKDILSFSYDGVKYGDIVYDTYLAFFKLATIKKIDWKILFIIYFVINRHESIRKILSSDNFDAVLVSHTIGVKSGVMLRTALRYGYKGYHQHGILTLIEEVDGVYDYPFKPSPENIDNIISKLGENLDSVYEMVHANHVSGMSSLDAKYAFDNKYYEDRKLFCLDYGIDPNKKNVFVMLHAFTDHPHSHFRWMIFKDYYDWFVETLNFAKTNDKVNWIFKQHPSIKFYPTKDVSFGKLFAGAPPNVIYISEEKQIDTRSLEHCADLILTCLGSAGYELPAMAGIPSLIAADTFYNGLGFTLEPKNKKEYFEYLSSASGIEQLTPEQQKRARAAYIHINNLFTRNLPACPRTSHEKDRDTNANVWYWDEICELYDVEEENIKNNLQNYIDEVTDPHFKKMATTIDQ